MPDVWTARPAGCSPSATNTVWVGERTSLSAKFRFDFCSRHLQVLEVGAAGCRLRSARAVVREVPPPVIPGTFQIPSLSSAAERGSVVVLVDLDELVEHWTLLEDERELVAGKQGPTRLGFALLLKFYTRAGRFPRGRAELDDDAVAFVTARSVCPRPTSAFTNGPAVRSNTTGHRSAATWGSGSAAPRTPPSSPSGSPAASAGPSGGPTGCRRNCWLAAGPTGSSRHPRALRPDHPLGPVPGRAGAYPVGGHTARPGCRRPARAAGRGRRR